TCSPSHTPLPGAPLSGAHVRAQATGPPPPLPSPRSLAGQVVPRHTSSTAQVCADRRRAATFAVARDVLATSNGLEVRRVHAGLVEAQVVHVELGRHLVSERPHEGDPV